MAFLREPQEVSAVATERPWNACWIRNVQNADLALSPSTPAALVKRGQRQETATAAEHCRSQSVRELFKTGNDGLLSKLIAFNKKKKKEEKSG